MKQTLVLDIEVYVNYLLIAFKSVDSGRLRTYEMFNGGTLPRDEIAHILRTYRIVTFNGLNYDMPIVQCALRGGNNATLKTLSNRIVDEGLKGWQTGIEIPKSIDHIDLMETMPGVAVSLKLYGARLHSKRLQDLPYEHTATIDEPMRAELIRYCENDLDTTIDLWRKAQPAVALREAMSAEHGIDLRSKSDAQVAEAVLKSEVSKLMGRPIERPTIPGGTTFRYKAPAFIKFNSPELQAILQTVESADFTIADNGAVTMPKALTSAKIKLGTSVYRMGMGGLHSSEKTTAHTRPLVDVDVNSYYPSLILLCGLAPKQMGGYFLDVYRLIYTTRLAAKALAGRLKAQLRGK